MSITRIVIHCAASKNGQRLGNTSHTAAERIDDWHAGRGFGRQSVAAERFNPHLRNIGYHFVIDTSGYVETGRAVGEMGAHVRGYNRNSVGVCLVGTDQFTPAQWDALADLVADLQEQYPDAALCGHRDLSADKNGDGQITPDEYSKICPGFNVSDWVNHGFEPLPGYVIEEAS